MYPKTGNLQHKSGKIRYILPEYLEATEIQALIRSAPHAKAKLLMTFQWRAGLRISEALAIKASDITLDGDRPTIHVRQGKGRRDRLVPIHPKWGLSSNGTKCTAKELIKHNIQLVGTKFCVLKTSDNKFIRTSI